MKADNAVLDEDASALPVKLDWNLQKEARQDELYCQRVCCARPNSGSEKAEWCYATLERFYRPQRPGALIIRVP